MLAQGAETASTGIWNQPAFWIAIVGVLGTLLGSISTQLLQNRSSSRRLQVQLQHDQRQRWWDRQANTYALMIEQVATLAAVNRQWGVAELEGREYSDLYKASLSAQYREGADHVRRSGESGAFFISTKAAEALERVRNQLDEFNPDYFADLEDKATVCREALEVLRSEGKKDLGVQLD